MCLRRNKSHMHIWAQSDFLSFYDWWGRHYYSLPRLIFILERIHLAHSAFTFIRFRSQASSLCTSCKPGCKHLKLLYSRPLYSLGPENKLFLTKLQDTILCLTGVWPYGRVIVITVAETTVSHITLPLDLGIRKCYFGQTKACLFD